MPPSKTRHLLGSWRVAVVFRHKAQHPTPTDISQIPQTPTMIMDFVSATMARPPSKKIIEARYEVSCK